MRRRAPAPDTDRPLLVSDRIEIVEALLDRLPEGAPVPAVAAEPRAARRAWAAASVVLVDVDLLGPMARSRPPRRPGVVLLLPGHGGPGDGASPDWSAGLRLGVEQALDVEEAAAWLASASATPGDATHAAVLAITGGRGGCGASSLAAALGFAGARRDLHTLLVDLDPLGGGLDIALGLEDSPGPRWPEVVATLASGAPPDSVVRALPAVDAGTGHLQLLSAGRSPASEEPDGIATVLREATTAVDLLVVDLPRQATAHLLPPGSSLLLVVPDEVRGCAAAASRVGLLGEVDDIRLVVRDSGGSLDAATIETALGLPVAGRLRDQRGLTADVERGIPPGSRPRSALAQLSDRLLDDVLAGRPMPALR